jgi:RNA polymerase sigma-70 factor (ECF subfamily)
VNLNEIILACQKNDIKAQEQLYNLLAGKLFVVCLKYSQSQVEAEDNLQECFLLIYEKIGQFQFKGSFEGWAKRLTVNYILQLYRKKKHLEIVSENFPEDVEVEIDEEDISLEYLLSLVRILPDRYRLVFTLYVLDGYTHKEIAEMLSIEIGTSKSNLARAKMILKKKIEEKTTYNKAVK